MTEIKPAAARNGTGAQGAEGTKPSAADALELVHRIVDVCVADNRTIVNTEASQVVVWALERVNPTIVDEAIGWWDAQPESPALPRAVASVIATKAADHGIRLSEFKPIGAPA